MANGLTRKDESAREKDARESGGKEKILAAIRQAAKELGRAPSRGELRRITGLSHYRVLAEFRTLREAVRAAGLEPNKKGEKISTGDLIKDWKRIRKKLGKRPSRSEYVREGRYSAGAFVGRFGSWGKISTAKDAKGAKKKRGGRELTRMPGKSNHEGPPPRQAKTGLVGGPGHEGTQRPDAREAEDKAIAMQWAASLVAVPGPVVGKRRVTEGIAAMIVNTLLPGSTQHSAVSIQPLQNRGFTTEGAEEHGGRQDGRADSARAARGVRKDRPVMGAPFDRSPMTNAPVNELGVVLLFGMLAVSLGFQVEWVQGRSYPDCQAKLEVAPGKWQHVRIEFEYESKNFLLHGHDPKRCDVIVCWRHNWKECPEEIEVIELSRMF